MILNLTTLLHQMLQLSHELEKISFWSFQIDWSWWPQQIGSSWLSALWYGIWHLFLMGTRVEYGPIANLCQHVAWDPYLLTSWTQDCILLPLPYVTLKFGDQGFISVSYSSSVHNLYIICKLSTHGSRNRLIWRKNKIPHHSCEVPSRFFNWNNLLKISKPPHDMSQLSDVCVLRVLL